MRLYDAHNHLQDERFGGRQAELVATSRAAGVVRMVVNGATESDWPDVARLAKEFPDFVIPAFGVHPWYVAARGPRWFDHLREHLDAIPGAVIGEIGLDRWILDAPAAARAALGPGSESLPPASLAEQEDVFAQQLSLAAERNLPASLHCLQAWGAIEQLLQRGPRPAAGFLLHSYGGPAEMLPTFTRLGGYFSFPGYFLHERKQRQRDTFRAVPPDRVLIETDAPDQRLPDAPASAATPLPPLQDAAGRPLNHPANLLRVFTGLAEVRQTEPTVLAATLEENFRRLFGTR